MTRTLARPARPHAGARFAGAAAALVALAAGRPSGAAEPAPPPPPPAAARLWVIAPTALGPWTMRIDNEGDVPLRVPADVRLLRLELVPVATPKDRHPRPIRCEAPGALRPDGFPEERALLLAPHESYIESFDPRLLCFGKSTAALAGSTLVRARLGWDPPPKWSRKPPAAPFAAEAVGVPPAVSPLRELVAPTMMLSYDLVPYPLEVAAEDAKPAPEAGKEPAEKDAASGAGDKAPAPADGESSSGDKAGDAGASAEKHDDADGTKKEATEDKPAPIDDAAAPRLEVTADSLSDAPAPRSALVHVTAKNVGLRPMVAALRSRMLAFRIEGPDGETTCEASPPTHAIPRDNYQTLKPGASASFSVLLSEACPDGALPRAGLYRVTPTLVLRETGEEADVHAYTGTSKGLAPTLLRLQSAPSPYYKAPPKAVPTPAPAATGD